MVFDDNFLSTTVQSHLPHPREVATHDSQEMTSHKSQEITSYSTTALSKGLVSREVQTAPVQAKVVDAEVQTDCIQPPAILGVILI